MTPWPAGEDSRVQTFRWRTLITGLAALATLTACSPGPEPVPTPTPAPTNTPEPVTVDLKEVGGIIMSSPEAGPGNTSNVYVVTFDASKIVSRVMPAVVTVINEQQFDNGFAGSEAIEAGRGTGFVVDGSGNVVTNEHVVRGGSRFQVILSNGEKRDATLVGSDPLSDLAVVRMDGEPLSNVSFGDSDSLQQGQPVLAIGSPLGDFTGTVTSGIVSALDRDFPTSVSGGASEGIYTDLIQHDAAINPGNSGGPLFDLTGRVIGVNTLGIPEERGTPVQGLFFAIPSNHVARIVGEIIQNGRVSYPFFGINYVAISPELAAQNDLNVDYGAYVQGVEPGGAAAQAGIREGDIIVAVGEDRITAQTTFTEALFAHSPGETVPVTVNRNGREQTLQATLAERPRQ